MEDEELRGTEGYETRDAMFGYLIIWGIGLALLAISGLFVARGLLRQFQRGEPAPSHPLREQRRGPLEPVLQADNRSQYRAYQQEMRRAIDEYAWIDTREGVVRVPQQRALELALERGFETREDR